MDAMKLHPEKTLSPMVRTPSRTVTERLLPPPSGEFIDFVSTMPPIETDVTPELVNTTLPRSVTLSGMTIDVNPVQNSKARLPIRFNPSGRSMDVSVLQPEKA